MSYIEEAHFGIHGTLAVIWHADVTMGVLGEE